MTAELLLTGTFCVLVVLVVLAVGSVAVLRQVKDKPRPLAEVVEAQGVRLTAVENGLRELERSDRRAVQREAKARQRAERAEEVETGELDPDVPLIEQDPRTHLDPRRRFAS